MFIFRFEFGPTFLPVIIARMSHFVLEQYTIGMPFIFVLESPKSHRYKLFRSTLSFQFLQRMQETDKVNVYGKIRMLLKLILLPSSSMLLMNKLIQNQGCAIIRIVPLNVMSNPRFNSNVNDWTTDKYVAKHLPTHFHGILTNLMESLCKNVEWQA